MNASRFLVVLVAAFGLAAADADAARRMGGGGNVGKQRAAPMQRDATPAKPAQPPAQQAAPANAAPANSAAAGGAAAAAKPSFMQRWGGLLAGLGIGALLASMFGPGLGNFIGLLLMVLLGVGVIFLLMRLFAGRRGGAAPASANSAPTGGMGAPLERNAEPTEGRRPFAGIGSRVPGNAGMERSGLAEAGTGSVASHRAGAPVVEIPGFEVEPFLRVAKTSFIRLQAANDAKDLNDIRDYTSPELYAALAMHIHERGPEPQRTEVVSIDARLVEAVVEGDQAIASVRFTGLIRERENANPEPFDEIWHVVRDARDAKGAWTIAGIQQVE